VQESHGKKVQEYEMEIKLNKLFKAARDEGRKISHNGFFNTQKKSTGNYTLSVRFKGKMGARPTLDFDSLIRGLKAFKIGFESLFAVEQNVPKRH